MPVQRLIEPFDLRLDFFDLTDLGPAAQNEKVVELATSSTLRLFDLGGEVLLRPLLAQVGEEQHVLVITMHHIAGDGVSMGLLYRQLGELYSPPATGGTHPTVQYADFARWQRNRVDNGVLAADLPFWTQYLRGAPTTLNLLTDRPRPERPSFRGDTLRFTIANGTTKSLRHIGQERSASLFMVLLAVLAGLLHRHSGQEDVLIGIPVTNRHERRFQDTIGFFVNTVIVRIDVTGDPSFVELLLRVRDSVLAVFAHAETPFEHVVRAVQPSRDHHLPLYQVMFGLQSGRPCGLELAGVRVDEIAFDEPTAKHDLTVLVDEVDGEVSASLEYSSDLFDVATAEYLNAHFSALITAVADEPERNLSQLSLMTEEEAQVVDGFAGATSVRVVDERGLPQPVDIPGRLVVRLPGHDRVQDLGSTARWRPDGALDLLGPTHRPAPAIPAAAQDPRSDARPDPTEAEIAQLWSTVLDIPVPARDADFFTLGGNSMAMMRINWELREAFGVAIPMTRIMENPTVAGLAELVDAARLTVSASPPDPGTTRWRTESLPVSGPGHLWNVCALGPQDIWAAGTRHTPGNGQTESVVVHFDGQSWQLVDHPDLTRVVGITARGPEDVWLSGLGGLLRWNGHRWASPGGQAPAADCASITTVDGQIWTLVRRESGGQSLAVAVLDGGRWRWAPLPLPAPVNTVHASLAGSAADAAWLSTTQLTDSGRMRSLVLRWDGKNWSEQSLPTSAAPEVELIRVVALAREDVWVLGARHCAQGRQGVALHWDGSAWTETAVDASVGRLNGLLRTVDGQLWAVGGGDGDPGVLVRWDGAADTWVPAAAPRRCRLLGDVTEITDAGELIAGGAAEDGLALFRRMPGG
jgi:acyl carrier protein